MNSKLLIDCGSNLGQGYEQNYAIDFDKKGKYDIIRSDILNYLKNNNINFVEWN